MNRKERRAAEKNKGRTTAQATPATAVKAKAEALKAQGMALKAAGREEEAVPLLLEALKADSSLADVHFTLALMSQAKPALGIDMNKINAAVTDRMVLKNAYQTILMIMKKRRQYKEAMVCQNELCRLYPDDLDEKANLALLYNLLGNKEDSLRMLAELTEAAPDNKIYKSLFASTCGGVTFLRHEPLIKKALQSCFDNIYEANLYKAYSTWAAVILRDPDCAGLRDAETCLIDENKFIQWIGNANDQTLSFLKEKFFLDGLRMLTIADPILENLLLWTRRWLCLNAENLSRQKRLNFFEPFLIALGEQCFYNEYIYSPTAEENDIIGKLIQDLTHNQPDNLTPLQAYALISCYHPLFKIFPDKKAELTELSAKSTAFKSLAKTQFFDLLEEEKIKKTLKTYGVLENEVSLNVQSQYEENPYPRWISLANFATPSDNMPTPEWNNQQRQEILVAGCGTGRHALASTAAHPQAHVTAIDLSRASLAYAQRKAHECGLAGRIDFIHADILSMETWQAPFDIIECAGVLHHMEDPFRGWQVLTDLLKPGGYFKVGLYSEAGRQQVVAARQYIKEQGFPATTEGIRLCRDNIMKLPATDPMRKYMVISNDFYATSLIRDLIFHVQEHRMTLPQIKAMMDRLGLECTSFAPSKPDILLKYDRMFPSDPARSNMMNWHEFEQKHPDTFMGMYQFWCRKTVSVQKV